MKAKVISTSPSISGITKQINEYFCSNNYKVTSEGVIHNDRMGVILDGYRVVKWHEGFKFVKI